MQNTRQGDLLVDLEKIITGMGFTDYLSNAGMMWNSSYREKAGSIQMQYRYVNGMSLPSRSHCLEMWGYCGAKCVSVAGWLLWELEDWLKAK